MRPLGDLRVIEFGDGVAGPFCGLQLASLGADVIKIESASGGDRLRRWPPQSQGFSEAFAALNRDKRSVALDLESSSGREAARHLALSADVVIQDHQPGSLGKLGLDYPALAAIKPSLVYCSISPFGQTGPRAQQSGSDLMIQALCGLMSVTGDLEGMPAKCGVPLPELVAGLYGVCGIQAALLAARRGEGGKHVEVSMLGAVLGISALQAGEYFGTGRDPGKLGSADAHGAPHQAYRAKDGWFVLAADEDRHWHTVCQVAERPELFADPKFTTAADRLARRGALQLLLEQKFMERPVAEWLTAFVQRGVPCAPISSYSRALSDPQVQHMGFVQPLTLPSGVATRTVVTPVAVDGTLPAVGRQPPGLGEHTKEVLSALGLPIPG